MRCGFLRPGIQWQTLAERFLVCSYLQMLQHFFDPAHGRPRQSAWRFMARPGAARWYCARIAAVMLRRCNTLRRLPELTANLFLSPEKKGGSKADRDSKITQSNAVKPRLACALCAWPTRLWGRGAVHSGGATQGLFAKKLLHLDAFFLAFPLPETAPVLARDDIA